MAFKKIVIAIATLALFTACAWAQMAPKPGAELKKLDYFVGTWTTDATIAEGPWGAGGKFTSTGTSEWMTGNFFVVDHADFKLPPEVGGEGKETLILGYNADQNVYTRDGFNSQGRRENWTGTLVGDTWTWTGSQVYAGQDVKQRLTVKALSPTSYSLKFDVSLDGTNWMPFMEGKSTKK
jgi:hypothetical protein